MIALLSLCLLLALVLYRMIRKPAGFPPGPVGLPVLGYLPFVGNKPYDTFNELAKKYGDVIGVNWGPFQRLVFLNSYSAIRDAFKEDVLSGRPQTYFVTASSDGGHGVILNQGADWREIRRYSLRVLRDFGFGKSYLETDIANETAELLDSLKKDLGSPLQLDGRFNLSVLNALWAMTTGQRIQLDDPQMNLLLDRLRRSNSIAQSTPIGIPQLFPYCKYIPLWLIGAHSSLQQIYMMRDLFQEEIERQLEVYQRNGQTDNFIKTFLAKISQAEQGSEFHGPTKGMKNLAHVVMDFFMAGAETVSTTLSWMIYYLVKNPHVQKQVHEELDRVVGRSGMPTLEDRSLQQVALHGSCTDGDPQMCLANLAFLTPPWLIPSRPDVLFTNQNSLLRNFETEFRGYRIPKGTLLLGNVYAFHRDPTVWERPDDFYPEHFLDKQGQVKQVEQLIPFLIGKRSCLGESLARMELFLFATHLLHTFQLNAAEGKPLPEPEGKPTFVRSASPYEVMLSLR